MHSNDILRFFPVRLNFAAQTFNVRVYTAVIPIKIILQCKGNELISRKDAVRGFGKGAEQLKLSWG